MKKYFCRYCKKEINVNLKNIGFSIAGHENTCDKNPKFLKNIENRKKASKIANEKRKENNKKKKEELKQTIKTYTFVCEKCKQIYTKDLDLKQYSIYLNKKHFCSRKCANSRIISNEIKIKISNKLRKYPILLCKHPGCGKKLKPENKTGYCIQHLNYSLNYRNNISKRLKDLYKIGKMPGWKTRPLESYPEKFWKEVLENNNIKYEFNYPISKKTLGLNDSSHYFLDFKIGENIDLEIDGKQHKYADRHLKDLERDEVLIKNGWKVYRIEWNEINTSEGSSLMKDKINAFLKWYNLNSLNS